MCSWRGRRRIQIASKAGLSLLSRSDLKNHHINYIIQKNGTKTKTKQTKSPHDNQVLKTTMSITGPFMVQTERAPPRGWKTSALNNSGDTHSKNRSQLQKDLNPPSKVLL